MLQQRWENVTFLHWRYAPEVLQRLLPRPLAVEEVDGSGWVGIVAFDSRDTRLGRRMPLPGGGDFAEINVRTYVRLPSGDGAVWFFSLDVASRFLATSARVLLRLPYRAVDASISEVDGTVAYSARHRLGVRCRIAVRPGPALTPSELRPRDRQLTERYLASIQLSPRRLRVPVAHAPWRLHAAALQDLDETLLGSVGLPQPTVPPEVRWSPGVHASVGAPRFGR